MCHEAAANLTEINPSKIIGVVKKGLGNIQVAIRKGKIHREFYIDTP